MKIYVASSWRNPFQSAIVDLLEFEGFECYDFKNPGEGKTGFSWSEIDPNWKSWDFNQYKKALEHPRSEQGYQSDHDGIMWADVCVLVLPCGRSAHTEAGYMKGLGKKVFVLIPTLEEPELMYKVFDGIFSSMGELIHALHFHDARRPKCERCGDRGWLYDDNGRRTGTCPCHLN